MIIGVPKEIKDNEARVGVTPAGAKALTEAGHTVLVETLAGAQSGFADAEYQSAGAEIVGEPGWVWGKSDLVVKAIHNERGYQTIRTRLANQFDVVQNEPEIEVVDVDLDGDRRLMLRHRVYSGILLNEKDTAAVLQNLAELWGYEVSLTEVAAQSDTVLKQHSVAPARGSAAA